MKIIKRNGAEVPFDITKIITAVTKASDSVGGQSRLTKDQITQIAADVTDQCQALNRAVSVEEVQDMVENQLMDIKAHDIARHYITYRYIQSLKRQTNTTDERILSLIECQNEEVKQENANKNPTVNSVQRDYMAGEISKDLTARLLLDPEIVKAHQEGLIHFHDSDYFAQHMHNCDLVNLEDMLQNGTVISGTYIEKPHSFSTACNIATQIIAQVASNQYGGQSISLTHLAPFVDVSRKKIAAEVEVEMAGLDVSAERKKEIVERRLRNEINRGVQTIQYQVVTLMTTNGQAPFITVFMYLGEARNPQEKADLAIIIEETIRQRYQGVKNEAGVWITPAFPKLIYVLEEDNIRPGTPYYYLTELAAKCTAKRMVPDYISEKKMLELKVDKNGEGHCYTCMGCRSFLTPYVDPETGKPKYYGRFNQGVVTINLVDVALSSKGNFEKFWKIFDERLALCHRALQARHKRLLGTPSDAAPILWQYGALARLKKGEKIDKLLFGGYSTISLGYAGLYECVKYMTGKSHTDAGAKPFALSVMQHMNDKCNAWKKAENIDYSLYGTPLESTTYKFAKCLQKRFDHFDTAPYLSQHQHLGKRGELMGRTSKNIKLRIPEKLHKIKGFRSGSYRVATTISSQTPSTTRTPLRVNQPYLLYHKSVFCKEFFLIFRTVSSYSSLCQPVFRTSASKKILHYLCTFGFTDAADDLCRMIKIGITDDIKDRLCPSGFSIRTAVNNLVDTTVDDSARTHWTGLDCNIKHGPL